MSTLVYKSHIIHAKTNSRRPIVPDDQNGESLYQRIYHVVRRIPPGQVASYGGIARMVRTGPRQVGYAMAALNAGDNVPWHRVINSRGEISLRKDGRGDSVQRGLLQSEGVVFDRRGRVDFERFGWIEADLFWLEGVND